MNARKVSTTAMKAISLAPVPAAEDRDVRAADSLGLVLEALVRERPLSRTWRARSVGGPGPAVGLVVSSGAPADRERFHAAANRMFLTGGTLPGVLPVHCVAPDGDAFVSDLWTAGSARDLAALRWTLRERVRFVRRVVCALEGLHAAGLVHGGLCPANILLDDDLQPVLAEAGMVCGLTAVGSDEEAFLHASCAPPEVKAGTAADVRSDVYSAGRVLDILAGDERNPAVADVVRRCTGVQPVDRYGSAAALGAALDALLAGMSGEPRSIVPARPPTRMGRKLLVAVVLTAVAAAACLGASAHLGPSSWSKQFDANGKDPTRNDEAP